MRRIERVKTGFVCMAVQQVQGISSSQPLQRSRSVDIGVFGSRLLFGFALAA